MTVGEYVSLLLFAVICFTLMLGYPVAFTLAGVSLLFALLGNLAGVFDPAFISIIPNRIYGIFINQNLLAVPLFVFMGVMLEKSKLAEELLDNMSRAFSRLPGGLGISVIIVGMLLAASTGIVGATVVTMGILSLPTMLKAGYKPSFACGTLCATGTLGQIIPPSICLVLLGEVISSAYQQSQLSSGAFAPEVVTISDLFAGALIPGLVLVVLYALYVFLTALIKPEIAPAYRHVESTEKPEQAISSESYQNLESPENLERLRSLENLDSLKSLESSESSEQLAMATFKASVEVTDAATSVQEVTLVENYISYKGDREQQQLSTPIAIVVIKGLLPPILLIIAVLGSILFGIATPTEAASVGALGATFLALVKRQLALKVVHQVSVETMRITSMVYLILIGASIFSSVFRGFGGDLLVEEILTGLPGGVFAAMLSVMLLVFLLGFILDFIEITYMVVPLVGPVLLSMGLDPVWLGIMLAVNLQTSFLTPPFGFSLFYLRSVAPPQIATADIYRGVIPFVVIQLFTLLLLSLWPALATWLPAYLD